MPNEPINIKPYGDTMNDGAVQISFTLPVPIGEKAKEAAKQIGMKLGLEEVMVYHMEGLDEDFTFFVLYGKVPFTIDYSSITVPAINKQSMDFYKINQVIKEQINRKIVVVGACTGTDAHTVGIDAIMNMKGYDGEYGLERYPEIEAYNLGSQVKNEDLLEKAVELNADAILVSQVVTQKGIHLANLTELVEMMEAANLRRKILLICGGPRISHELASELGYDAGFGPGTKASEVASFIVEKIIQR